GLWEVAGRVDVADTYATGFERQPRKQDRGEVAADQEDLVPLPPGEAIRDEVEPVRGAVAKDHLVGGRPEQASQGTPQPRRHLCEPLGGEFKRTHLPGNGLAGFLGRYPRQRPLVGTVQPDPPVERTKVEVIIARHGINDSE